MKEKEISRGLAKQEKLLLLDELVMPEFLKEGKMISDENLLLVNQLIEKAETAVVSEMDPEVKRFFKWIIERFDDRVEKHKGGKVFKITVFIWYDQEEEHVKVETTNEAKKKVVFVVNKKEYVQGMAVVKKTLEMIDILKNFDLSSIGQEGEYNGWPYAVRDIIMRL